MNQINRKIRTFSEYCKIVGSNYKLWVYMALLLYSVRSNDPKSKQETVIHARGKFERYSKKKDNPIT